MRHIPYQIRWSEPAQQYVILHNGDPVTPIIEPGSPHWLAWLETIPSFSFQSRDGGSSTIRKETVQRGGAYWYAYRRKGQRMVKRYLARHSDLTLARLESVTAALNDTVTFSKPDQASIESMQENHTDPVTERA